MYTFAKRLNALLELKTTEHFEAIGEYAEHPNKRNLDAMNLASVERKWAILGVEYFELRNAQ
jgi:hypothetical protein